MWASIGRSGRASGTASCRWMGCTPLPRAWLAPETVRAGLCQPGAQSAAQGGEDRFLPDDFSHEQSMVLETGRGLVVLNSCCHGGVVNIVKGVLDQFPGQRVYALLGGLHMLSPGANALNCPRTMSARWQPRCWSWVWSTCGRGTALVLPPLHC